MPSAESNAASLALSTLASDPAEVSGDAGTVKNHKLSDMIAYDQYMASKDAAQSTRRGLRITRLVPPGTID